jgi:formylglycine-generating enzyme required for sulfatase activity
MLFELIIKDESEIEAFYRSVPHNQFDNIINCGESEKFEDFILIPSGSFLMGSWRGRPDETPVHVVLVKSFGLGRYPVTNGEFCEFIEATDYVTVAEKIGESKIWTGNKWKAIKGLNWKNPRNDGIDIKLRLNHPVVQIAWQDAIEYCKWKTEELGKLIELPSEAEWEYAYRAGSRTNWCCGNEVELLEEYAWYKKNLDRSTYTQPVGRKKPNQWGLYDMPGNVREWCADVYDRYPGNNLSWDLGDRYFSVSNEKYHVLRGGHFGSNPQFLRSGIRVSGKADLSTDYTGFRLKLR